MNVNQLFCKWNKRSELNEPANKMNVSGSDTDRTIFTIPWKKPGTIMVTCYIIMKMDRFVPIGKGHNSGDVISGVYKAI